MRQFAQNIQNRPVGVCHHTFDDDTSEDRHCLLSWKRMNFRQKVFHSSATPSHSYVTSIGLQSTLSLGCEIVQRKGPPWHWDIVTDTKKISHLDQHCFLRNLVKRGKCKKQTQTKKKQISKSQEIRKAGESFLTEIFFFFPWQRFSQWKAMDF